MFSASVQNATVYVKNIMHVFCSALSIQKSDSQLTYLLLLQSEINLLSAKMSRPICYCCLSVFGEVLRNIRVLKLCICNVTIDFDMEMKTVLLQVLIAY